MRSILFTCILLSVFSLANASDLPTSSALESARSSFKNKDYKKAIRLYEEVIEDDALAEETRKEAFFNLGISYEKRGEEIDAAYFFGEFVRTTKYNHPSFSEALFKAGQMNFKAADPEKDQGSSEMAIFYLSNFLELYPQDTRVVEARRIIKEGKDNIADYHYTQFGLYYLDHDNFCGAFIAFEDSLDNSDMHLDAIIAATDKCNKSDDCKAKVINCIERFELTAIKSFNIIK